MKVGFERGQARLGPIEAVLRGVGCGDADFRQARRLLHQLAHRRFVNGAQGRPFMLHDPFEFLEAMTSVFLELRSGVVQFAEVPFKLGDGLGMTISGRRPSLQDAFGVIGESREALLERRHVVGRHVAQIIDLRLQTREALLKSGSVRLHLNPVRDDTQIYPASQPRTRIMIESLITVAAILVLFVALPALVLYIAYRRRVAVRHGWMGIPRAAYERQLLAPDWTLVERHLGRPVPRALRELYANHRVLTATNLTFAGTAINTFEPLTEGSLLDTADELGFDILPIATTVFGDPLYLRPGADGGETVYVTHHDGGDTAVFAESVAQLAAGLRPAR